MRHSRVQKLALILVWDVWPIAAEVSEIASAGMQFRRQNSNQRQARPLPEAETSKSCSRACCKAGWTQSTAETGTRRTSL